MPNISREMSWLSPKRRRTTGNLRKIPNGQVTVNNEDKVAPSLPSPTLQRSVSAYRPDSIPEEVVAGSSLSSASDGNLFYAYARKVGRVETTVNEGKFLLLTQTRLERRW